MFGQNLTLFVSSPLLNVPSGFHYGCNNPDRALICISEAHFLVEQSPKIAFESGCGVENSNWKSAYRVENMVYFFVQPSFSKRQNRY